ncbi:palmitoyltransferase ZDHHC6 [Drosophila grimshawi]|uniref:Palmitoyltransferase n=1 Tax=Drosophila grimshawi TaxID=7222 RepID=B4J090_DROGR|nr:palmitoyltransferase ZDHHC6 [Drosophila grimshawi]EDV95691.1 GH15638 [Drosophila grimshawi]
MAANEHPNELRRFVHWGPITVLIITSIVTLTTWRWWPSDLTFSTSAHFGLFVLLNLLATYNFVMAVLVGSGLLLRKWKPVDYRETKLMQYCKKCEGYKAPRSHHCRRCDRCVLKMDHHCPWINCCVGWANQAYFVYFLFFYMLSNLHAAVVLCCVGFRFISGFYYSRQLEEVLRLHFFSISMCIFGFGLAVGIVLCMLKLLLIQMSGILRNQTDVEYWILQKASTRRYLAKLKPFVFPYDLGWYANLGQVFNIESQMRSKGIHWALRSGCDRYDLTCEQLAQKADKRKRTRIYKCIRNFTGYWLPIWSQGLWVTISIPCTDDPRIILQPDDIIRVTRIRKHWLFGERVIDGSEDRRKDQRKGPIRGWFPCRCAIDITKEASEIKMKSKIESEQGDMKAILGYNSWTGKQRLGKINQD